MAERDERSKGSELDRSGPFLGPRIPFAEAWPAIADIRIEVTEQHGRGQRSVFTAPTFRRYVDCSESLCHRGGVNLQSIVDGMVKRRQTQLEITRLCEGDAASPSGRRVYQKCTNNFTVKVSITYKSETTG